MLGGDMFAGEGQDHVPKLACKQIEKTIPYVVAGRAVHTLTACYGQQVRSLMDMKTPPHEWRDVLQKEAAVADHHTS
eukprot:1395525-Prorocentrum_lima.AAC.1